MTDSVIDINIVEVKTPDMDATLVAENIASQLERRIAFRRAMKQCVGRTMRMGAKGIKFRLAVVWAVLKSLAAKAIVKAAFLCILCVLILIMAQQKLIPLMAVSA